MNEFLKTRTQILEATQWLKRNGYISHPIDCKNWELMQLLQNIGEGDCVDLGADGSFALHNVIKKNIKGRKVGIDLIEVVGDNKADGAEYFQGDIQATPFDDNSFDTIISLSTIEHAVDLEKFVNECDRLLRVGGQIFLSFDYWTPKPNPEQTKLYSLSWNILDMYDVDNLEFLFKDVGIELSSEFDGSVQDAVITPQYCSPAPCSYTFGFLHFIKK